VTFGHFKLWNHHWSKPYCLMGAVKLFGIGPLDSLREQLEWILAIPLPSSAKSFVSVIRVAGKCLKFSA
jgi:hypothetical protein